MVLKTFPAKPPKKPKDKKRKDRAFDNAEANLAAQAFKRKRTKRK